MLHYRGRGVAFATVLLVQTIPFQLLMIPLYVLLVRDYGLGDTYLGMILPFAINATAVFIFRQFFLQLPRELFDAARIDGASESPILWRIAIPLARPAILTVTLLTFIGPWNEFLWPFLITKKADMQPLAVSLANYIANLASRAANPFGAILAGACVLAAPVIGLFIIFQRHFTSTDLGLRGQGLSDARTALNVSAPSWSRSPGTPDEIEGVLNPAVPGTRRTVRCTCCRDWSPGATCHGLGSPASSSTMACRSASSDVAWCWSRR